MDTESERGAVEAYVKAQRFYFLAEQCLNLMKKSLLQSLRHYDLSHSQHMILLILRYAEFSAVEANGTAISYLLGMEKHSVTAVVDSLVRARYVKRSRSASDRRVVHLHLTGEGRRLADTVRPGVVAKVRDFPGVSEDHYEAVMSFLEELRTTVCTQLGTTPELYRDAFTNLLEQGERALVARTDAGFGVTGPAAMGDAT